MIELYTWRTPNGFKPLILLEETGMEYKVHPVNIGNGEQFAPAFLEISPNNKIPAIVDNGLSIFESGAILIYLAEKAGQLLPSTPAEKADVMQWLMWQIGGLGPMLGQAGHFKNLNEPYANKRFGDEAQRLLKVLDKQLTANEYVAGDFSIADIAIYPWIKTATGAYVGIDLAAFGNIDRWVRSLDARPSVVKSYELGAAW